LRNKEGAPHNTVVYIHTYFNDQLQYLVTAIKLNAKYRIQSANTLLYILRREIGNKIVPHFSKTGYPPHRTDGPTC